MTRSCLTLLFALSLACPWLVGCEVSEPTVNETSTGVRPADAIGSGSGSGVDLDSYVSNIGDTNTGPPDVSLGVQPLAGICTQDSDCADGACNAAYPSGYCTIWCSGNEDCPEDAKCFKDPETKDKMCWKVCAGDWDCRSGQFCPSGANICTPKCVTGSCGPGYVCDLPSGQCVAAGSISCDPVPEVCDQQDNDCDGLIDEDASCGPELAQSEAVFIEDMGRVTAGGGGLSNPLVFSALSTGSAATILVVDVSGVDDLTTIYNLTGPNGQVLISASDPFSSPIRAYPDIGNVAVQIPNTPSVSYEQGTYTFTIYRDGDQESQVWVYVIHSLRNEPEFSKMDVNYWFVGTPGLTASSAPNKNKFQNLHSTFKQVMTGHGVTLGEVKYMDVTGSNASKYTYVDTGSEGYEVDEHAELLQLSGALPSTNRGVNFFFVQGFNGWGLLGKAGGIPGPPLIHGTYHSGVVVSLVDYYEYEVQIGIPVTAETMAHELGHQLGLFHTTEQDGTLHDPIPDTPECTYDGNNDGAVDLQECKNSGANNLMFWSVSLSAKLTAGQKSVIHKNASMY